MLEQLDDMEDSQIVTLTVGGNEVDFFLILNECIHQWHPLLDCDSQLVKSKKVIESGTFIHVSLVPNMRLYSQSHLRCFEFSKQQTLILLFYTIIRLSRRILTK